MKLFNAQVQEQSEIRQLLKARPSGQRDQSDSDQALKAQRVSDQALKASVSDQISSVSPVQISQSQSPSLKISSVQDQCTSIKQQ